MIYLFAVLLIIYVFCCLVLVGFILTQEGKGGGLSGVMGASMGETFGFGGATSTIRKFTSIAATVFMLLTVVLTFVGERVVTNASSQFLRGDADASAVPGAPVAGSPAPATRPAATTQQPQGAVSQPIEVKTEAAPAAAAVDAAPPQTVPAATTAEKPAEQPAPAAATEPAPAAPAEAAAATTGSAAQ